MQNLNKRKYWPKWYWNWKIKRLYMKNVRVVWVMNTPCIYHPEFDDDNTLYVYKIMPAERLWVHRLTNINRINSQ